MMPGAPLISCPLRRIAVLLVAAIAATAAPAAPGGGPAQVLIINSFSRENSPYEVFASLFRRELAEDERAPVAFYDTALDGARFDPARDTEPFVRLLRDRFADRPPDLVVPVGPLAAQFYTQNRSRLFPGTPMFVALAEGRVLRGVTLGPDDASLTIRLDIGRLFRNILDVLPRTTTIAVVIGNSPIERFWTNVVREETKPFADRVSFQFWNELSLKEVARRASEMPKDSAILFAQMYVDGAGESQLFDRAFARVRATANAPMFGLFESLLGNGIVGGPLISEATAAKRAAEVARVALAGGALGAAASQSFQLGVPAYDWRELQRWGIPEERLPQQSQVLFRTPSLWEQHKLEGTLVAGALLVQSGLLAGLLVQRARRRRAEREALMLSGRILTAHEDERRSLARELHDDVTPRLAHLAIEAARAERDGAIAAPSLSMHDELVSLSEDVHAFSYRLHPTILDDLGLVDALRSECDKAAHGQALRIDLDIGDVPERIPGDVALCLYRVAQEALRNVFRHAGARGVNVSLLRKRGGLELTVADDGEGFVVDAERARPSLGHASMRERVRQVGGELSIRSAPGAGTTIVAWVPWPGSAA